MSQRLSQIRNVLDRHGLRPKRSLGQNFLHDANKVADILAAADLKPEQQVLEVGPGTGVLTELMIEAGVRLVAVELDRDLCDIVQRLIGPNDEHFHLVRGDVMAGKHGLNSEVYEALGGRDKPFKLVANLPYNLACPLLVTLATDWPGMHTAVVMLQREVADRIVAPPGGKDYGPVGIVIQSMCEHEGVTELSPNCFWPKPKVSSKVIKLTRRDKPLTSKPHMLSSFVKRLFGQRRKQIGTILGEENLPKGFDRKRRPEQLSVEELIDLSEKVKPAAIIGGDSDEATQDTQNRGGTE